MGKPRSAKVKITYTIKNKKTKQTAEKMAEFERGFTYCDAASGESDTISLDICNRDMRWANKWMPKKKSRITATISTTEWGGKIAEIKCGKFCVDDITLAGPELSCQIGGVSVPEGQAFRATARSKTWKNITLKEISRRIAKRYHMKLVYSGPALKVKKAEQSKQNDCEFLAKLCDTYGYAIKVYAGKLVIYYIDNYEKKKAVAKININDVEDWSYNTTLTSTYTGAKASYDVNKKTHTCKVGGGKRILVVSEKASSLSDAKKRAIAAVNKANRSACTLNLTIYPNLKLYAGCNIQLVGAYNLNGKYFIDKVTHQITAEGGYTMQLEIHKVMPKVKAATNKSTTTKK